MSGQTLQEDSKQEPNQPRTTATFQTADGNTWTIRLTYGLIQEIHETTQIEVIPDDLNLAPLAAAAINIKDWANLLWICIRKQAETKGVTQKDFVDDLDADSLSDSAEALAEAIHFFCQKTKGKEIADAAIGVYRKAMAMMNQVALAMLENLDSPKTNQAFKEVVQEAMKEQQVEMKKELTRRSREASMSSAIN